MATFPRFFDLPREIRDNIYTFILQDESEYTRACRAELSDGAWRPLPLPNMESDDTRRLLFIPPKTLHVSLLLINKQTSEEIRALIDCLRRTSNSACRVADVLIYDDETYYLSWLGTSWLPLHTSTLEIHLRLSFKEIGRYGRVDEVDGFSDVADYLISVLVAYLIMGPTFRHDQAGERSFDVLHINLLDRDPPVRTKLGRVTPGASGGRDGRLQTVGRKTAETFVSKFIYIFLNRGRERTLKLAAGKEQKLRISLEGTTFEIDVHA